MSASAARNVTILDHHRRARGGPINIEILDDELQQGAETQDGDGYTVITIGGRKAPEKQASKRFDANLAEDIDASSLSALASSLIEGIEADLQSRKDWEDTANQAANYLGIKLQDPTTSVSVDGTICKAVATVMLEATARLWGVARAELLPVSGPVQVRRTDIPMPQTQQVPAQGGIVAGPDAAQPQPDKDELAAALEKDLNWYLTVGDREYYPDYSKMLLSRAVVGNAFRKVYRCPLKRKPVSSWVKAQDLIVSNDCSHLSGAGRVTERIRYRQATMRRLQVSGHYRDIALVHPTGQSTETEIAIADSEGIVATPQLPGDFEHLVYECYCEIGSGTASSMIGDLSGLEHDETGKKPGYPLPYRVSIDFDSQEVLEIRRNWREGDKEHQARRRYVKYGFVPGFGFYDWGLIHLLGNPTQVATMLGRSCVDSALFANFPAFVAIKGPGSRQSNTVFRPNPGEVVVLDAAGAMKIQDVLMPMPYKPPSGEAMALASKVEGDAKRLAGVIEIPVGEGRVGNTPVGTIMSYIEAISQVPGAVHKDDHIAQQDEFEMLRELIAEEPEVLTRGNRSPARQWQIAQEILDPDLTPAADPNTPSEIHRLMKTQLLVEAGARPQFQGIADNRAIYRKAVRVLAGDEAAQYELPQQPAQPPPPDPKIVVAQIKADGDQMKVQAAAAKDASAHQEKMVELAQEGQQRSADRQSAELRADMSLQAARTRAGADLAAAAVDRMHDTANKAADRAQDHAHHVDEHQRAVAEQMMPDEKPAD